MAPMSVGTDCTHPTSQPDGSIASGLVRRGLSHGSRPGDVTQGRQRRVPDDVRFAVHRKATPPARRPVTPEAVALAVQLMLLWLLLHSASSTHPTAVRGTNSSGCTQKPTGLRGVQGAVCGWPLKELDGFPCGGDPVEDRPEVRVGVVAVEGGRGDASGSEGVQAVADAGTEKR
jgi:hypothetical protein